MESLTLQVDGPITERVYIRGRGAYNRNIFSVYRLVGCNRVGGLISEGGVGGGGGGGGLQPGFHGIIKRRTILYFICTFRELTTPFVLYFRVHLRCLVNLSLTTVTQVVTNIRPSIGQTETQVITSLQRAVTCN